MDGSLQVGDCFLGAVGVGEVEAGRDQDDYGDDSATGYFTHEERNAGGQEQDEDERILKSGEVSLDAGYVLGLGDDVLTVLLQPTTCLSTA